VDLLQIRLPAGPTVVCPSRAFALLKRRSIIVTVGDEALGSINQLADKLAERGMQVDQVMPVTGVIAGSVPASRLADLVTVDGVSSVEEELVATLPPPDSELQ
jgi:hypothetical protein